MVTDEELADRLDARLMNHGVYVTSVERDDRGLHLTYETVAPGDGVPHREVGRVCNFLRDAADDGWAYADVHATVTSTDGDRRGTWRADADWFRALDRGDLSEVEFSGRVLETIEEA
jgi:hypothetical protein